jgi:hypothetical protein
MMLADSSHAMKLSDEMERPRRDNDEDDDEKIKRG